MTVAVSRIPPPPEVLPRAIGGSAAFGVVLVSPRGRLLGANGTFQRWLGYPSFEALRAKSVPEDLLRRSGEWRDWQDVAAGADAREIGAEFVAADGQSVFLLGGIERVSLKNGGGAAVRAIVVDNTAAHQLRELSLKAARMEGALNLAAGVSHDFNNLLTVVVGNLYLIAERLRNEPVLYEKVRKARDAAKRGAGFARQLLDIARGADGESEPTALNVGRVIESLSPLLTAVLGAHVVLKVAVAAEMPTVLVNRAQLESVVTNLVINARDAVAGRPTGTVSLSFGKRELSSRAGVSLRLRPGVYVEMSVGDDGCGIPPELVNRVFETFFSTKKKGTGSGLGLPMVRWFAEKAGGTVLLESRPNEGTVVTVLLPAHHAEAGETTVRTMPLSSLPGGNEKIAVFSNDADFCSTVEQILSTLGYRTIVGSVVGSTVAMSNDGPAAVVVDAQTLTTAAAEYINTLVSRRRSAIGIVVVGNSRVDWPVAPVGVPKPFTLIELANAVRAAVDGG